MVAPLPPIRPLSVEEYLEVARVTLNSVPCPETTLTLDEIYEGLALHSARA